MTNLKRWVLVILPSALLLIAADPARAYDPQEGNVTATLGPIWTKTNFRDTPSGAHSPYYTNFGLIALGDINEKGALEIGMFHLNKLFLRSKDGMDIAEQTEMMHMTMGYRRWINPYFSASWSFFSSYAMGDPVIVHSSFPKGQEIDTSARDITEYGTDFAVQGDLWSHDKFAVIAEARYSLSVTPKSDERADHYGFMIGLRYFVQEKDDNDKSAPVRR